MVVLLVVYIELTILPVNGVSLVRTESLAAVTEEYEVVQLTGEESNLNLGHLLLAVEVSGALLRVSRAVSSEETTLTITLVLVDTPSNLVNHA